MYSVNVRDLLEIVCKNCCFYPIFYLFRLFLLVANVTLLVKINRTARVYPGNPSIIHNTEVIHNGTKSSVCGDCAA